MKTQHSIQKILFVNLLFIILPVGAIVAYILRGTNIPVGAFSILFLELFVCSAIILYQAVITTKLREEIEKQRITANIPYCCPGHDFSCPYVSSPYQKNKECSECENGQSSDLDVVWILNFTAWDDKSCPAPIKKHQDTMCYTAKRIALKDAKEEPRLGIGSCVFVHGSGGYYELVSKVKL